MSRSPIARAASAAQTELSTPPDRAMTTLSSAAVVWISSMDSRINFSVLTMEFSLFRPLVCPARFHEAEIRGGRLGRAGLELGVELGGKEERVAGQFQAFHPVPVGGGKDKP